MPSLIFNAQEVVCICPDTQVFVDIIGGSGVDIHRSLGLIVAPVLLQEIAAAQDRDVGCEAQMLKQTVDQVEV